MQNYVIDAPTHLKCSILGHGKLQGGEEISQQQPEQAFVVLDEFGEVHVPARTCGGITFSALTVSIRATQRNNVRGTFLGLLFASRRSTLGWIGGSSRRYLKQWNGNGAVNHPQETI